MCLCQHESLATHGVVVEINARFGRRTIAREFHNRPRAKSGVLHALAHGVARGVLRILVERDWYVVIP
jgi:hypothetical protein